MNEFVLIQKAKLGDKKSFEKLYDRYARDLYKFIYYKVNSKEIAEDLSSETWIQAVKSLERFSVKSSFKTWLFGIAKHLLFSFYSEKYTNKEVVSFEEFIEKDLNDVASDFRNLEPTNYIDEDIEKKDSVSKESLVKNILAKLKPVTAKVLELRFLKGYSIDEVAKELNMTVSNVKVTQMRAIEKLRRFGMPEDM